MSLDNFQTSTAIDTQQFFGMIGKTIKAIEDTMLKNEPYTLQEWKDKGDYVRIDDFQIFYLQEGKGPLLLMLHAYPIASWGWHKIWKPLSERYSLLALDLLGSGFSDKPDMNYSIIKLADVVERFMQTLQIKQAHILAHASGSMVAQELLARKTDADSLNPFDIESAAFINGGMFAEIAHITFMQRFLLTKTGAWFAKNFPAPYSMFRKNFARHFGEQFRPSDNELQTYWQVLTYNDGHKKVPQAIVYLQEREIYRDRWVGALQKTQIPLGLIVNTSDPFTGAPLIQKWKEMLPESALIQLPSPSGHYPLLETPGEVVNAIDQFSQHYTHAKKSAVSAAPPRGSTRFR